MPSFGMCAAIPTARTMPSLHAVRRHHKTTSAPPRNRRGKVRSALLQSEIPRCARNDRPSARNDSPRAAFEAGPLSDWLERERSQPYDFEVRPKPKLRKACGKGRSITRTFLALLALAELGALPAQAVKRKASFNTSRVLKIPTPEIDLVAATAARAHAEPQSHRTLLVTVVVGSALSMPPPNPASLPEIVLLVTVRVSSFPMPPPNAALPGVVPA